MQLVDLQSPYWDRCPGAFGSVRDLVAFLVGEPSPGDPELRRQLLQEEDPGQSAFEALCDSLSDQMSFHPAMYLVLPYMVRLLGQKAGDFSWQLRIFSEIGLCLAADVPWEHTEEEDLPPPELLDSYREAVCFLARQAERFLKENRKRLRREGVFERRRLCLGLYALLGDRKEAFAMAMNRFETCYVQCGNCGQVDEDLELVDGRQRKKLRPVRVWQRKAPEPFQRFRRILHDMGDWEGEELLACYYGVYTCPLCGKETPVMEGLIAAFDPGLPPPAQV